MNSKLILTLLILLIGVTENIQAQCVACVIDTSVCSLTGDGALCADTLATGTSGLSYDENVTFTMAKRYVVKQGDTIPGLGISVDFLQTLGFPVAVPIIIPVVDVTISDISGLPAGINWECDSMTNGCKYVPTGSSPNGCVRLCGIPDCDSAGNYNVAIEFNYLLDMQQLINSLTGGPIPFPFPIPTEVPTPQPLYIEMVVNSDAPAPLTVTANKPTTISQGESIILTATIGYTTYTWSSGDTTDQVTVSPNQSTIYTVEVSDPNGCTWTETIDITVLIATGIKDITTSRIHVFPNPSDGKVEITLDATTANTQIQIYDLNGKNILSTTAISNKLLLDLSVLSPGFYHLNATGNNYNAYQRLIIN